MKTNILKKYKWCIVALVLMLSLMAVSVSYSYWDNLSIKTILGNNGSGDYYKGYKVVGDTNGNKIADVGDVVTFGNYYQQANQTAKTPIRWIVVEKQNNQLTLLAEQVLAYGSFWGTFYYDDQYAGTRGGMSVNGECYYQNYAESTLRKWLNFHTANIGLGNRSDGGSLFKVDSSRVVMRGFANEAFSQEEYDNIITKPISGVQGYKPVKNINELPDSKISYGAVSDKVWVPSYGEIFGTNQSKYGTLSLGNSHEKFSYFNDVKLDGDVYSSKKAVGSTTAFAVSQFSNYTDINATSLNNCGPLGVNKASSWWLRTPPASESVTNLRIDSIGGVYSFWTDNSVSGVRPAIIIPC